MRRWILIFFLLMFCCGCQPKDSLTSIINEMPSYNYQEKSEYVNCTLELVKMTDKTIRYRVIIDQPKANLDNVRAIALCNNKIGETIPSFGFYENDKCNLYINKTDVKKSYYEGISLIGLTDETSITCYVYLSFEVAEEVVEEYIILEGTIDDAS